MGVATVTAKGWKGPSDLLGSYVNLEKLVGAPPEQIIRLPKDMTHESMLPVYDRLGRPKTAAEYKLDTIKGSDPEMSKLAAGWFHEAGAPVSMATKVVEKWNAYVGEIVTKSQADYKTKVDQDKVALRGEWGDKHDSNLALAKQAAAAFGINETVVNALEKQLGYAGTHKFLHAVGSKIGEAEFVQGGGQRSDFGGLTPESAQAQITALRGDRNFAARFNSSDPVVRGEAQSQMARLNKIAYPGQVTL